MNVYRLKSIINSYEVIDLDIFEFAEIIGDEDLSLVRSQPRTNESLLNTWGAPSCSFSKEYKQAERYPDISFWGTYLLMSADAKRAMYELLNGFGEFLPIKVEGCDFYLFNCLTFGLEDKQLCILKYSEGIEDGLESLAFNSEDVQSKPVFKSKLQGSRTLFANEKFKQCYDSNNFSGLRFDTELLNIF
ncbi:hypothetical protein PS1M3_11410 [Pseudoalteromonas sp. PS1M3]|uniref:hypothetical protein n=1 Tax=Pseudoalteromonas sp. PS1M3 TaxID=87791 RepID=UPI00194E7956|nr:hypothetical protein [Pseudoalteromonas sp. PS1M3]BBW91054.1 hypothetical protein PS1M3_11410 [Pseudoalteromonas sp. PS1M3]